MEIRKATRADYDRLLALDTLAAGTEERCDQIRNWLDTGVCYVAQTGELAVAYGVLHYHFFGHGFIEMIMVGAQFRRKGLGLALVRHFQQRCATQKLFTSTNLSNHSMQTLLQGAGFRSSGFIDDLDDNDPEIVFCFRVK